MKKYNIAVHILFWILVIFLLTAALLLLFLKDYEFSSVLPFLKSADLPQEEKVIVREVKEIEREVEWYYFVASGYSANDPAQGTNDTTATGKEVGKGIIAVDPEVIPLGARVEIKGMGVFTAEDTGGKIKGNRIDIFFTSKEEAKDFGRKGIWVRAIGGVRETELAGMYGDMPMYENSSQYGNMTAQGYHMLQGKTSEDVMVLSN